MIALVLSSILFTFTHVPPTQAATQITNAGFETGNLSGWTVWTNGNNAAVYVRVEGMRGVGSFQIGKPRHIRHRLARSLLAWRAAIIP